MNNLRRDRSLRFTFLPRFLMLFAILALSACGTGESMGSNPPESVVEAAPAQPQDQESAQPAEQPDGAADPASQQTEAVPHEVTIVGRDHAFEAPDEVPAGLLTFTFQNEGESVHHLQIVRLNDGVTFEQLMEAFAEGGEAEAFPLFTPVGGPALTDPGATGQVTLNLDPGAYALLCFVMDEEGIPHLAMGMARPLTLTGDAAPGAEPQADLTVSMADFQYAMPTEVEAGPQTWEIVNDGPQPHELVLHKLAPGKTVEDVLAFIHQPEGEPPFTNAGGMQGVAQGGTGWVHLDLTPGVYVAICYIPDPESGAPHLDLGMVRVFTVGDES